jgi:nitric oxide reductase subunit B
MVHTNLLIVWLLLGFMGAATTWCPRNRNANFTAPNWRSLLFWVFLVAGG